MKCLSKEKADRYTTAAELRDDLQRYLSDVPIHARPVSRANRAWRWVRRNRVTAALCGIGMMADSFSRRPDGLHAHAAGRRTTPARHLTSEPEGANVAFIPLDELTGEPLPDQIIHCARTTPLEEDLPPGSYLIVAYLEDGSERFHEVYRRVPFEKEQGMHGGYVHLRWFVQEDGTIELPAVTIPSTAVADGMARFESNPNFIVGEGGPPSSQLTADQFLRLRSTRLR